MKKEYKAAMIVIGDEILSGRTEDKNINYVANKLVERGISLCEVRIVGDIEYDIINAVNDLRNKYDYVFTSGGIGPTHDDITAETIAKAFGVELEINLEVYELLKQEYKNGDFTKASEKMAMIPRGAKLIPNPLSAAPGFIIDNVYVMAGVPVIMHAMIDYVVGIIEGGRVVKSCSVSCTLGESRIALGLKEIQARFPDVSIGSYPSFDKDGKRGVSIVLRSVNEDDLLHAKEQVKLMIDKLSS